MRACGRGRVVVFCVVFSKSASSLTPFLFFSASQLADLTFAGLQIATAKPNTVALAPLDAPRPTDFSARRELASPADAQRANTRLAPLSPREAPSAAAAEATAMHEEMMRSADGFAAFLSNAAVVGGVGAAEEEGDFEDSVLTVEAASDDES